MAHHDDPDARVAPEAPEAVRLGSGSPAELFPAEVGGEVVGAWLGNCVGVGVGGNVAGQSPSCGRGKVLPGNQYGIIRVLQDPDARVPPVASVPSPAEPPGLRLPAEVGGGVVGAWLGFCVGVSVGGHVVGQSMAESIHSLAFNSTVVEFTSLQTVTVSHPAAESPATGAQTSPAVHSPTVPESEHANPGVFSPHTHMELSRQNPAPAPHVRQFTSSSPQATSDGSPCGGPVGDCEGGAVATTAVVVVAQVVLHERLAHSTRRTFRT